MELEENTVAREIVDASLLVHRELGPGLLESVYEVILAEELSSRGFPVERQVSVPLKWKNGTFTKAFESDAIVSGKVLIELKSVERLQPVHFKQTLTYLRLLDLRLGVLVNFGENLIKNGIHRIVNGLPASHSSLSFAP